MQENTAFVGLWLYHTGPEVSATFNTGDVEAAVSLASEQLEKAMQGDDLMKAKWKRSMQ